MSWILLEGLDRSGKSTVAEIYRKQGYDVVHLEAPDKKFSEPGYSGPSYLEEIVDMYNIYSGKDVVFDRTIYGELIWPSIFGRVPLLNDEDIEYLSQLEYHQDAQKIVMIPTDKEAHWKRCADNNEPINRMQFVQAGRLYEDLTKSHGFERKTLEDFDALAAEVKNTTQEETPTSPLGTPSEVVENKSVVENKQQMTMDEKLSRANAIRTLLKSSLIKKKDDTFQKLEADIKEFLNKELECIFTEKPQDELTKEEVKILKIYVQRIQKKLG